MSKEARNIIDEALFNYYLDADKQDIRALLGEDVDNLTEYDKRKKRLLFLLKAESAKKKNEHLLTLVDKFKEAISNGIEKPITLLKQLIQTNPSLALYRNLDRLTNEDIIEIIKDKNLIELLEQFDKDVPGE